nr:hypothetical protein [Amycolatopsis sp. CA-230715]
MSNGDFLAFAGLTFLMIVVPGPSVLFTISRALTVGKRDAQPHRATGPRSAPRK